MSGLADVVNSLSMTGLEAYEASQGQPINIATYSPSGTVSVGNPTVGLFSGGTGLIAIILGGIALIFFARSFGRR